MDIRTGGSISENVRLVLEQIRQVSLRSGRPDGAVRLIAATKSVGLDDIREGIEAGLTILGENRLQEALPKIDALRGASVRWHYIGHLQRRKVRSVVGVFDLIHSVDSLELAEEIDRRAKDAGVRQAVLLEVNLDGESTKTGFHPDELAPLLPRLGALPNLDIQGLMAIPSPVSDPEQARPSFRRLRELTQRLSRQMISTVTLKELSMGMSSDYSVAVEEGATMVRVGTAIFGARRG
ncbi:MAG: YggS family pyridoxal phosphate-dependent enzyme [Nitrospira sp.]|nr:YggS family pyridoxal phosphate-dependent enzyme [Nitrospira sp.]